MNYETGSKWRKWDFHVHTPFSILNNQFGLNAENEEDFDSYVHKLFKAAIEKDIYGIGITDYFSIAGYRKIREEYLNNPKSMERLFPKEEDRKRIGEIIVFPNIEFRVEPIIQVGQSETEYINYHVIFSDEVDPGLIEANFLSNINFKMLDANTQYSLIKRNIEKLGENIVRNNGGSENYYKEGLSNVLVSTDEILDALEIPEFKSKYFISVAVDESLSKVNWKHNRGYNSRLQLYRQSNAYMTSSESTRKWALAETDKQAMIDEFGSIKPCIWGSDAHCFEKLFEPDDQKYCWIKADTTFEGFLQVLCEPQDRIIIQEEQPGQKDPYRVIHSIRFDDSKFQKEPILFNEGLNCIIGGRSTGKSMLLRHLARAVDPEYAADQERVSSLAALDSDIKAYVKWGDGESGRRKIVYIPQTYLNRTIDDPQSSSGTNKIIGEVLAQNREIKDALDKYIASIKLYEREMNAHVCRYYELKDLISSKNKEIIEFGTFEVFSKAVEQSEANCRQLTGENELTEEELQEYKVVVSQINDLTSKIEIKTNDLRLLGLAIEADNILNISLNRDNFTGVSTSVLDDINYSIGQISAQMEIQFRDSLSEIKAKIDHELPSLFTDRENLNKRKNELDPKIQKNIKLREALARLNKERQFMIRAKAMEDDLQLLEEERGELRAAMLKKQKKYYEACLEYCALVKECTGDLSDLEFAAEPVWKIRDFQNTVVSYLDGRKLSGFRNKYGFDLNDITQADINNNLIEIIWNAVETSDIQGSLQLRSGLKEKDFVTRVLSNYYNVHYIVRSDNDSLEEMSPGKKGLVLLELIVQLESGNCPILIDQPEDDLDNRSIHADLRRFIINSKKNRQIIVVTHNANIALGADSEEIIVANQNGTNCKNRLAQFEYITGAIESNKATVSMDDEEAGYLEKQSIQEHLCSILEGGLEAFEARRKKYLVS